MRTTALIYDKKTKEEKGIQKWYLGFFLKRAVPYFSNFTFKEWTLPYRIHLQEAILKIFSQ